MDLSITVTASALWLGGINLVLIRFLLGRSADFIRKTAFVIGCIVGRDRDVKGSALDS